VTKLELAAMLERFLGDTPGIGAREWDNFTTYRAEPELEPYRQRLNEAFGDGWNDSDEIRRIMIELRDNAPNQ
jgi:hypothetical protein